MTSRPYSAGAAAVQIWQIVIVASIGICSAACGSADHTSPSTTTTSTTSHAPTSPAMQVIGPTSGNSFTPSLTAPPAPIVQPGQHPGLGSSIP